MYISDTGIDVRSECLRKLLSHVPMFELSRNVDEDTGHALNPDSEVCIESTAQLCGIHPFYIPRGRLVFIIILYVSVVDVVDRTAGRALGL